MNVGRVWELGGPRGRMGQSAQPNAAQRKAKDLGFDPLDVREPLDIREPWESSEQESHW